MRLGNEQYKTKCYNYIDITHNSEVFLPGHMFRELKDYTQPWEYTS